MYRFVSGYKFILELDTTLYDISIIMLLVICAFRFFCFHLKKKKKLKTNVRVIIQRIKYEFIQVVKNFCGYKAIF